jgi:hypothetical protein
MRSEGSPERNARRRRQFDRIALLGLVLAAYSAVLATGLAIHTLSVDDKSFKVDAWFDSSGSCPEGAALRVRIANTGHRPLSITWVGFKSNGGAVVVFPQIGESTRRRRRAMAVPPTEPGLPRRLAEGDVLMLSFQYLPVRAFSDFDTVLVDDADGAEVSRSFASELENIRPFVKARRCRTTSPRRRR